MDYTHWACMPEPELEEPDDDECLAGRRAKAQEAREAREEARYEARFIDY